jgi:hypothetical protein
MPALEDLLRDALRRVTDTVQPGQLRPLRVPAPGPRWRPRLLLPLTAAAVVVIAVVAGLLVASSARPVPHVAPASAPAAMPRYYVTVAEIPAGLETVVRDSAHGSVTGTAPLPDTRGMIGQSVAAAANGRVFVVAVDVADTSTIAGTVDMRYFRLPISADGRPGTPTELPEGLGNGEPLTGMAVSGDGTMLALSLERLDPMTSVPPTGDIEVVNLATGRTRTWTSHSDPGYWPGAATWMHGNTMLTFAWWHITSPATGTAVIAGVRRLHLSAPGNNLVTTAYVPFRAPVSGIRSALITADGRDIIASSCRGTSSGGHHDTAQAQILQLPVQPEPHLRVLDTQTATFKNATDEQDALAASCSVLSVDPSGNHVLVQAFNFGRLDNGGFTALPGASPRVLFVAAGW